MKKITFIILIAIVIAILPIFTGSSWLITVALYCLSATLILGVIYLHDHNPKKRVVKQNKIYYLPEHHTYLHE